MYRGRWRRPAEAAVVRHRRDEHLGESSCLSRGNSTPQTAQPTHRAHTYLKIPPRIRPEHAYVYLVSIPCRTRGRAEKKRLLPRTVCVKNNATTLVQRPRSNLSDFTLAKNTNHQHQNQAKTPSFVSPAVTNPTDLRRTRYFSDVTPQPPGPCSALAPGPALAGAA